MFGRSAKSVRNVITGLLNKVLMMVLAFATRTIFIRLLGAEYTGISSLYTNILSVLSLAEMGMGNVLMFYLYSALKDHDEDRIRNLVDEFKKIYRAIIVIVLAVGVALVPFLRYIVHSTLDGKELVGYYFMYLINSVSSYFVVYRTMILSADQKSYIPNIVNSVSTILMYVFQIIYLYLVRDFWGYLAIQVLHTIGTNLALNHITVRQYPFLKNRRRALGTGQGIKKRDLFVNIKATFLFKISDTILDQTDSIIISIMFGTVVVGYYSNYFILISYIVAIAGIIANGLVASFGNLNTEGNMEYSYRMFRVALTAFSIFGIIASTCYASVVQDFIPIWVGSQYVMPYELVIAILAVFYLRMSTNTMWMYRSSMGIFQEVQYINLAAAGLNIILSIALGKLLGVAGVIVATAISRVLTSFWFEARVVFRLFKKPLKIYLILQLKNFIICLISVATAILICGVFEDSSLVTLIAKLMIALIVSCTIAYLAYGKTDEFKMMISKLKNVFVH